MDPIQAYYDANAQREWERFDRHPTEFAITKRVLAEYLPPADAPAGVRILDCGGGPGRYSIYLARLGYRVTLLDLSTGNLALAQAKAQAANAEIEAYIHGNALDLSRFSDGSFDGVLLLGPLYHLVKAEERAQAVGEALRLLKPGGLLLAGFITLYAPLRDILWRGEPGEYAADSGWIKRFLATQVIDEPDGFTRAWFARSEQVDPLMETAADQQGCRLARLALLAVEGIATTHEAKLAALDEAAFEYWADVNYRLCADPHLLGAADHLLYVGKKI